MRKETGKKYDVIIVGGGITGLLSAAILSGAGRRVLVVERTGEFGGMLKMIKYKGEEYYFGAHHIAGTDADSVTGGVWKALGMDVREDFEEVTHMRLLTAGKSLMIPLKLGELETYIKERYPGETGTEDFFSRLRRYQTFFREGDQKGLLKMFLEHSQTTYYELLRSYFKQDEAVRILAMLGPGYGGIGIQGPAFNNLSLLLSYSLGSGRFKEGNTGAVKRLIALARQHGCVFLSHTDCVDIRVRDGRIRGIVCKTPDGTEEYEGENLLFASYPFAVLKPYLSGTRLEKKLEGFHPGPSVIRVCGRLARIPDSFAADTVYMGGYGAEELDKNIFLEDRLTKLPVCMICVYREAGTPRFLLTFQVQADKKVRIAQDKLLQLIKNELPELAEQITDCFVLYDDVYRSVTNTAWGSVFGWQRTPYVYLNANVYTPCMPGIKGLYIAGNWSTDYGVYGALRTARKACEAMMKKKS